MTAVALLGQCPKSPQRKRRERSPATCAVAARTSASCAQVRTCGRVEMNFDRGASSCKSGGALVVGFSLTGVAAAQRLPRGRIRAGQDARPERGRRLHRRQRRRPRDDLLRQGRSGPGIADRHSADGRGGTRRRRRADRDDRGRHGADARSGRDRGQQRHHARRRADPPGRGHRARGAARARRAAARHAGGRTRHRRRRSSRAKPAARASPSASWSATSVRPEGRPKAPLKDPRQYTVVGKSLPRPDIPATRSPAATCTFTTSSSTACCTAASCARRRRCARLVAVDEASISRHSRRRASCASRISSASSPPTNGTRCAAARALEVAMVGVRRR